MKKINILILAIIFLTGCQSNNSEQLIAVGNRYSVSLPSFLVKAGTSLNEDASLEYLHTWKEFYVIVIDESKSEMQKALVDNNLTDIYTNDIDGYSSLILDNYEQVISISNKSEIIKTRINEMPARLITINGYTEGINAYYSLAFIQGKDRYYQIMAWTLSEKESKYKDKMKKIMNSFKEL